MVNKEFGQNRYQAGRFEAKTRNAFLGEKHRYDLKAQFLSNPNASVETFNPLDQKFIAKLAGENPQQQAHLINFVNNFQTFESSFGPDLELQNAPLVWAAMDRIESLKNQEAREAILNRIKAKKEQAKQVVIAEPTLKTENALQSTIGTIWKLQSEKLRDGLKSILDLPFFIINNLPDRVYKVVPLTTILALILSACAVTAVPNPEIPNQNNPVPGENTGIPDSPTGEVNPTIEPSKTITPAPTETQAVSQVDQLLTSYLAGESVDVSILSPSEFREFSTQLAEKRNAERGINPIIYNNEAYISPDNYMMMNYDGHPDMNETIQMYLPIAGKDGEGNLQIINHDGEIVTIENSADVDWNMRVTDPHDTRINWPTTKILESGFVEAQYRIYSPKNPSSLMPAILLDKNFGNIFLEGEESDMEVNYRFIVIETDEGNNPIVAREIMVIAMPTFNLYAENSPLKELGSPWKETEYSSFYKNLEINNVYYIGGPINQDKAYLEVKKRNPHNYSGIIYGNDAYSILNNQSEDNENMIVLATSMFIKKQ